MSAESQKQGRSFVHRLHPLVKVSVAAGLTFYALALDNPAALGLILAFLLLMVLVSRMRMNWKYPLVAILAVALFAAGNYLVDGDPERAAMYTIRLLIFITGIPLSAMTTAPEDIARSLARLKLPDGIILAVLMIWRFFPALVKETHDIRQADALRGIGNRGIIYRWYRAIVIPITFLLFEHSERVSLALEFRGFDPGRPRTWFGVPVAGYRDFIFLLSASCIAAGAAVLEWVSGIS